MISRAASFIFCVALIKALFAAGCAHAADKYTPSKDEIVKYAAALKSAYQNPKGLVASSFMATAVSRNQSRSAVLAEGSKLKSAWDEHVKAVNTGKPGWQSGTEEQVEGISKTIKLIAPFASIYLKTKLNKEASDTFGEMTDYAITAMEWGSKVLGIESLAGIDAAKDVNNSKKWLADMDEAKDDAERRIGFIFKQRHEAVVAGNKDKVELYDLVISKELGVDMSDTDETACLKMNLGVCQDQKISQILEAMPTQTAEVKKYIELHADEIKSVFAGGLAKLGSEIEGSMGRIIEQEKDIKAAIEVNAKRLDGTISENRALLDRLVIDMEKKNAIEKARQDRETVQQIQQAEAADTRAMLQMGSMLLSQLDSDLGRKYDATVSAFMQIDQATKAFEALGPLKSLDIEKAFDLGVDSEQLSGLGVAALTMNYVNAAMTLYSVFSSQNAGPSADQLILEQIGKLSQQISAMQTEMHDRFDRVDTRLNGIYSTMVKGFADIGSRLTDAAKTALDSQNLVLNTQSLLLHEMQLMLETEEGRELAKCLPEDVLLNQISRDRFIECNGTVRFYALDAVKKQLPLELSQGSEGKQLEEWIANHANRVTDALWTLFAGSSRPQGQKVIDPEQWRQVTANYAWLLTAKPSQTFNWLSSVPRETTEALTSLKNMGNRIADFRQNVLDAWRPAAMAKYVEKYRNTPYQGGLGQWRYDNGSTDEILTVAEFLPVTMDAVAQRHVLERMPLPLRVAAEKRDGDFVMKVRADTRIHADGSPKQCVLTVQFVPDDASKLPFDVASAHIDYPFCVGNTENTPGHLRPEHVDYVAFEYGLGANKAWVDKGRSLVNRIEQIIADGKTKGAKGYFGSLGFSGNITDLATKNIDKRFSSLSWSGGFGDESHWGGSEYSNVVKKLIGKQYFVAGRPPSPGYWLYRIPEEMRVAAENGVGYFELSIAYTGESHWYTYSCDLFNCYLHADWDKYKAEIYFVTKPADSWETPDRVLLGNLVFYQRGDRGLGVSTFDDPKPWLCMDPSCLAASLGAALDSFVWQNPNSPTVSMEWIWTTHQQRALDIATDYIVKDIEQEALSFDDGIRWENAYHRGLTRFAFGEVIDGNDFAQAIASGLVRLPYLSEMVPLPNKPCAESWLQCDNARVWQLPGQVKAEVDALEGILKILGSSIDNAIQNEGLRSDAVALENIANTIFDERFVSDCINIRPDDADHDKIGDACDSDDDNDGISDGWEKHFNSNPVSAADAAGDSDHDGLTALREYQLGTDPGKADSDGDGVADKDDDAPADPTQTRVDSDGDDVRDPVDDFPLNPFETRDTDADGVGDHADGYPYDPGRQQLLAQVAAGSTHTLALKDDGSLWAWGNNKSGQLGNAIVTDMISAPVPVLVSSGQPVIGVTAVATGYNSSLALKDDGTVLAWGTNAPVAELGTGGASATNPLPVIDAVGQPVNGIHTIAAGCFHYLALKKDGSVLAWGSNSGGQVGDGTRDSRARPVLVLAASGQPLKGIIAIAAGCSHSLALTKDGQVMGWGTNATGQLGNGSITDGLFASPVLGDTTTQQPLAGVTSIAAGVLHSLALKGDGTVWAWGQNSQALGLSGTPENILYPTNVKTNAQPLGNIGDITAGCYHAMALQKAHTGLDAWGRSLDGRLGNGISADGYVIASPVLADLTNPLSGIQRVFAGCESSFALQTDGYALAWGNNKAGQLGNHTTENRAYPTAVLTGTGELLQLVTDQDHDGYADPFDNCATTANTDQANKDGDMRGDACDAFPEDSTRSVDLDSDGDGVKDSLDAFPKDSKESVDTDKDGLGNNVDSDDDNDGVDDGRDAYPLDQLLSIQPTFLWQGRSGRIEQQRRTQEQRRSLLPIIINSIQGRSQP